MKPNLRILLPVLSLALLQPLKGATIGLQWSLRLGGFGTEDEADRVG